MQKMLITQNVLCQGFCVVYVCDNILAPQYMLIYLFLLLLC